jgi:hypothetical protein
VIIEAVIRGLGIRHNLNRKEIGRDAAAVFRHERYLDTPSEVSSMR